MKGPAAEFVLSDWTPCCCSASVPPSCLAVNHTTEGFMGKRRALARRAPLCNAADPLRRLIGRPPVDQRDMQICTQVLFFSAFFYFIFMHLFILGFIFTVNILCNINYINYIKQLGRSRSGHRCKILISSDFSFFFFFCLKKINFIPIFFLTSVFFSKTEFGNILL